jgi:proline iminopeptidase
VALPIPAPRESGFTSSTSHPLYWCRYGRAGAPRLLVLHGGPGAHHDYLLPHFLDLADEFELIFYDQRGGGRSKTDDPAPITWHTHVDDLTAVIAELHGDAPPTFAAYSWGALLAMLFAIECTEGRATPAPDLMVLVDPAPISRRFRERFEADFAARSKGPQIQAMRADLAASGLRESDPAAYKQRTFELSVAGYFADPTRAADLTPFRVTGRVQTQVWDSLGEFDLEPALRNVRVPSLVVHGRQDPIPLESSYAAAKALGTELVVLDDCGHVPYVEQRAALFDAMRAFLHQAP